MSTTQTSSVPTFNIPPDSSSAASSGGSSSSSQLWSPGINSVIAITACAVSTLLGIVNLALAYRAFLIMKRMIKLQEMSTTT
jgi:hypothetical protein